MVGQFNIILYISLIFIAYLLGSISSSIILSKAIYGVDIRNFGSNNPGANNIQRVLGWKIGLAVLLLDMAKGAAAVCLVFLIDLEPETNLFVATQIIFGTAAVLGHIFPVFHEFKGGKGVATLCGCLLAMHPLAVLFCVSIFIIMLVITKYVSVSVITAVTCFPFLVNLLFGMWLNSQETLTLKIFSIIAAIIVWLTHISNIKRLIHGKEEKFVVKLPVTMPERSILMEQIKKQ